MYNIKLPDLLVEVIIALIISEESWIDGSLLIISISASFSTFSMTIFSKVIQ